MHRECDDALPGGVGSRCCVLCQARSVRGAVSACRGADGRSQQEARGAIARDGGHAVSKRRSQPTEYRRAAPVRELGRGRLRGRADGHRHGRGLAGGLAAQLTRCIANSKFRRERAIRRVMPRAHAKAAAAPAPTVATLRHPLCLGTIVASAGGRGVSENDRSIAGMGVR